MSDPWHDQLEDALASIPVMRAEIAMLRGLLAEALPVVESEAMMMESMGRHMIGAFPDDGAGAQSSARSHFDLRDRIKAATSSFEPQS